MAIKTKRNFMIGGGAIVVLLAVAVGLSLQSGMELPFLASTAEATTDTTTTAAEIDAEAEETEPSVPVEVVSVARRSVAAFHRAASSIEADRLVEVPCRAAGRVRVVHAEEGDWVESGDIMAELENDRQKVELRRAELKLAEQQRKLERSRQMQAEELISEEEFDTIQATHDQAVAERDLAQITLDETYVKAPYDGQVTNRTVVDGQQVQSGIAAYTLADFSPLRVRVHLPEPIAAKVNVGEIVVLETEIEGAELSAEVERVSPVVDPATGTVRVTLRLPEGARARVGGFVKARLTTDRKRDVLAVPKLALVEEGGMRSVFVAEADTVRKVEIATGLYDETHIEITGGLEEGWSVVTLGRGGLRTGSHIEVLEDSNLAELAAR